MKAMFNPSLMCMDLLDIKKQTEILNERCDLYHVDIMDGHFVKNITLSPDFVAAFAKIAKKPIDCHLMCEYPDDYIETLAKAGVTYICPHAETINSDAFRIINKIRALGCRVGVVLNPATPLSYIQNYIHKLDKITIMSVDPGFADSRLSVKCLTKLKKLRSLKKKTVTNILLKLTVPAMKTLSENFHKPVQKYLLWALQDFSVRTRILRRLGIR